MKLDKDNCTEHALKDGLSVCISRKIDPVYEVWDALSGDILYLNSAFYRALEEAPPSGTSYVYCIVKKANDPVGIVYFQLKQIKLDESLQLDKLKAGWDLKGISTCIKRSLAGMLRSYSLVGGNMTLTGNYGSYLTDFDGNKKLELIDEIADVVSSLLKKEGINVRVTFLKDFYEKERYEGTLTSYTEFSVQPNMIFKLDPSWKTFDDYLGSMKSKYRVRVRRARKKADGLERRELSLEEVKDHEATIKSLYANVVDNASFNLFFLPDDYFYALKKHFGKKMRITGYFEGEVLKGFSTSLFHKEELDAHFLGYDPDCNRQCQLYLNMLYDMVEEAIDKQAHQLIMSRTAMEIKSSVGAEAVPMYLYLKLSSRFLNRIFPKALDYFKPESNWQARSPFK